MMRRAAPVAFLRDFINYLHNFLFFIYNIEMSRRYFICICIIIAVESNVDRTDRRQNVM